MTDQMEYIGRINKDGGDIKDFPMKIKKQIYDLIMSVDLDEADKLRSEGQYGMYQSEETPGLSVIVYDEKIVALIRMGVYDLESESVNDEKLVAVGIPRNDIERLIEDN